MAHLRPGLASDGDIAAVTPAEGLEQATGFSPDTDQNPGPSCASSVARTIVSEALDTMTFMRGLYADAL
ncbi:hypothetical protein [Bradyrhizobium sp. Tv2a-2]|uniref:hypothetical protein n=1 Tax=Bradyrhizobium sp. Tv2a-2 TaxID=113395 RepID=UPI00040A39CF|nr:hypothetical protein [Bradyrhizobium sp. Tv2a-2]